MSKLDVIIIGTGRVGLPLGLSLAKNGLKCAGIDINENIIKKVNNNEMPFKETGYEDLINEVEFKITNKYEVIKHTKNIIITVGTPLRQHIEIDLCYIKKVIRNIIPNLVANQNIILRSTVAPNTTKYIKNIIEKETNFKIGKDLFYITILP
jgi:UDP-N-acetyl-D-mannosaminuronic acid dehydrogenase